MHDDIPMNKVLIVVAADIGAVIFIVFVLAVVSSYVLI